MDSVVKQMIDGFNQGIESLAGMVSDQELVAEARQVIQEMRDLAEKPGMDVMKFQNTLNAKGLMSKYSSVQTRLSAIMMERAEKMQKEMEGVEKIDLKNIDITNFKPIMAPHRMAYTNVKDNPVMKHHSKAYEQLFELAEECETIPEFNRRAQAEGYFPQLGQSATYDANHHTFELEYDHEQPDMLVYALDALQLSCEYPFPDNQPYALNRLAFFNDRKMAVRKSELSLYNSFLGELGAYMATLHTEKQRQKVVALHNYMVEFNQKSIDEMEFDPYARQFIGKGNDFIKKDFGPDFLGIFAACKAFWHMDAKYSPEEKKQFKKGSEMPLPPDYKYPHRTGPVGGVDIKVTTSHFAKPFDESYEIELTVTNQSREARGLDQEKGLRMWVIAKDSVMSYHVPVDIPASIQPNQSIIFEGNLYDWGLAKKERLCLIGFDLGLHGDLTCDLAEKYKRPGKPFLLANKYLKPYEGGVATDPLICLPHRSIPKYPFPIEVENMERGKFPESIPGRD